MNNKIEDVLLITGGLAPQVVTETLYAMAVNPGSRARDAFWPDRVIVAGTSANRRVFAERGLDRRVDDLCVAVRKPRPGLTLLAPLDAEGREIDDIRSGDDAEAFGTMVVALVQELALNPALRLHVSLAGGRKTMSFHAGVALSLYGRDHDQLSHVLLDPPEAEGAAAFWYPTVADEMLSQRDGSPLETAAGERVNARTVKIDLARIPYYSVRNLLPKTVREERPLNYGEVVAQVRMALGETPIMVTLNPARREIMVPGLPAIKLPPQPFAFYQLLCEWARESCPGAGPEGIGGNHVGWLCDAVLAKPQAFKPNAVGRYFEILHSVQAKGSLKADRKPAAHADTGSDGERGKDNIEYFRQARTKLSKAFAEEVPNARVREALFKDKVEEGGTVRYGVGVSPFNISILDL